MARRTASKRSTLAGQPAQATHPAAGQAAERAETDLEFAVRDGAKVQGAAMDHAATLIDEAGVTQEEIDGHADLLGNVEAAVDEHGNLRDDAERVTAKRIEAARAAADRLADLRRRAHLAFSAGRPREEVDRSALRAVGVGAPLPASPAGYEVPIQRAERGLKNKQWAAAMKRRKVDRSTLVALKGAVAAWKAANQAGAGAKDKRVAARGVVMADVAELKRQTTYFRVAANTVLPPGDGGRGDFDPPARRQVTPPPDGTPPGAA